MDLKIEYVPIDSIKPYKGNAKTHPAEQIEQIKASIKEFGFKDAVAVWKNEVMAGNGRLQAAKELGMKEIPIVRLDDLTDEQRRAYALVHNKLTMNSPFDDGILSEELENILDIDMSMFDFGEVFEPEPQTVEEDDFDGELPEEPKSKLGDIYQLGEHRLMCGDSTNKDDVARLMEGAKADMVFTDPPYGMKKEKDGVLNDNLNFDELLEFNKKWIPLTFDNAKENGSWYCWGTDEPLMDIYSNILKPMIKEDKITFRNLITWRKGAFGSGGGTGVGQAIQRSYFPEDEKCLFVMCGVQGFNNNAGNYFEGFEPIRAYLEAECEKCGGHKVWKEMLGNSMGHHYFTKSQWCFPTKEAYEKMQAFGKEYGAFGKEYGAFGKEYEKIKKEYEKIKKEWYETRAYFDNTHDMMTNVWDFGRVRGSERVECGGHSTPKPIALCSRAIKSSSRENGIVLDVFGGSGSTLMACEQLNRKCYMMEMSPKYVDVIIKRWEDYTGKKAEKL